MAGGNPIRLLHFADAHIDIANYGRHDPETALPYRVIDFLNSLDQIIDTAVNEPVDLVIFAGDAYKDRNPQPTFQRAWGKRMMRLSGAGIHTVMLVGNHDRTPAIGRATTIEEYRTLEVPYVHIADTITMLGPKELGLPVQIITIPWISRNALMARDETSGKSPEEVLNLIEIQLAKSIEGLIANADPELPLILTAHASIQGAKYGSEKAVTLGHELVLSQSAIRDKRLDYVALGHIHQHQSLNEEQHPPIVYPGSIERIDFGEAREKKGFVLAEVKRGHTDWRFVELETRPFFDITIEVNEANNFMSVVLDQLPTSTQMAGAVCRLQLYYPRDWEPLLDEAGINERFKEALSFQLVKHRETDKRSRLGDTIAVEKLSPEELLDQYWQTIGLETDEASAMQALAKEVLGDINIS